MVFSWSISMAHLNPSITGWMLNITGKASVNTFWTIQIGWDISQVGWCKSCYKFSLKIKRLSCFHRLIAEINLVLTFPIAAPLFMFFSTIIAAAPLLSADMRWLVLFIEVGWTANQLMRPMGALVSLENIFSCVNKWSVSYWYLKWCKMHYNSYRCCNM